MANLLGQKIGRYQILEELGLGSMTAVYKAFDTHMEREVALKIIRADEFGQSALERMSRRNALEAKAEASLMHAHIVPVLDYGSFENAPYMVMSFLPGGSLADRDDLPIPYGEAARLLLPIVSALEFTHQRKIIHRNIKPSNILFTAVGEPMLSDFGIANILGETGKLRLTGKGMGSGKTEYMPPEQWEGIISPQADIYALGVVFYELVTGHKPYPLDPTLSPAAVLRKQLVEPLPPPRAYTPDLPSAAEAMICTALAKMPEERYPDMQSLTAELIILAQSDTPRPALDDLGTTVTAALPSEAPKASLRAAEEIVLEPVEAAISQPLGTDPPAAAPSSPAVRHKRLWALGAALLALLSITIVGFYFGSTRSGWRIKGKADLQATSSDPTIFAASAQETPNLTVEVSHNTPVLPTPAPVDVHLPSATPDLQLTPDSTLTPKPGTVRVSEQDGMIMIFIPEGSFVMGSEIGNLSEQPIHAVYLDSFWIDHTEVTNAMYARCVDAGDCTPPQNKRSNTRDSYYSSPEFAAYPVIWVSWNQANNYCAWAGRRLPTEAEWEKAARGPNARIYPWGDGAPSPDLLNFDKNMLDTTEAGSYTAGASPYKVLDMAGNVWEWVADWYGEDYYVNSPSINPTGPAAGQLRVVRGGSWFNGAWFIRSTNRQGDDPNFPLNSRGFRCAFPPIGTPPNQSDPQL